MRSRWFHRPLLHSPLLGLEKKPTWLELFYDLVFVAAFIQLGNGLSSHASVEGFLTFAATFVALWVAWTGFTFFENRFTVDDFTHRLVVFAQMATVGGMAIGAPLVLDGDTTAFSLAAGSAQLLVALMYARAWRQVPDSREYCRYWGWVFGVGGALWIASGFVSGRGAIALWVGATLAILAAPLSRHSRQLSERFPIDFEHLGERYGLLTIIVLGESFVKVLSALAAEGAGAGLYLEAGVTLLLRAACGGCTSTTWPAHTSAEGPGSGSSGSTRTSPSRSR
jgi:low temperature requirement protein LtrA